MTSCLLAYTEYCKLQYTVGVKAICITSKSAIRRERKSFCSYDLISQTENNLLYFKSEGRSFQSSEELLSTANYQHTAPVCPFTADSSPCFISLSTAVLTWRRFALSHLLPQELQTQTAAGCEPV